MIALPAGATAVSTVTVRDGQASFTHRGTGHARTRYEIGSITKTLTVLLLCDLAAAGLVSLDDPVNRHLPPPARLPGPHGPEVTLRHLAAHTSGLPRLPRDFLLRALPTLRTAPYARYPGRLVLRAAGRCRIRHAPGSRTGYSTFGIGLLGVALSRAAGTGWADLIAARVTGPLGLADTGCEQCPERDAVGHSVRGKVRPPLRIPGLAPAGALRSTVTDLGRYLAAWADPDGTPLAAAMRLATTARLGWERDGELRWHSGATPGFTAFAGFCPSRRTALAALTAVTPGRGGIVTPAFTALEGTAGAET
ncbi:serine hydrolase domain-containing protein [Actinoplanes flavus]|uniref:Beta-lactamase family protein n=1 Tax=Actinoplanes flavus TaxID=2820290 RepID=A0ABS3UY25_9ACTN|nr:serine hydrolase domain-containing protein [Actinoplanes flavus]MBO3743474.1 beta-lactamase family protein [Actinoplanes flavus]